MLEIRSKKSKDIEKDIYRLLKENGLNNRFTTIISHSKEWIIPNDSMILVSIYAGSNEGWYVSIMAVEIENPMKYTQVISLRIQESLESAIMIQNKIIRNIQL